MWHRHYKCMTLLLALLLAVSSWMPMPGRAEAQMRCVGASPNSVPCARTELPVAGLTQKQVYSRLMSCCRSMRGGCAMVRDCPMRPSAQAASHRSSFSTRHCLITIRVSTVPMTLSAPCVRWLLTPSPALAPPLAAPAAVPAPRTVRVAFWTYMPALSPHSAPTLHGLRAPPAA